MKNVRLAAFPDLNAFLEEKKFDSKSICEIFLKSLTSFLSELGRYVYPFP